MRITDLASLQKIKNNLSKDGYKIIVKHIEALDKEIEILQKLVNELSLEKEVFTNIDAKIIKKLLKKRDSE